MSLDVEKYKKIAAEATKKAYELCQETEGWNQVSTNVGDEATLEWREGDVGGVVRDDGEEGGAAATLLTTRKVIPCSDTSQK